MSKIYHITEIFLSIQGEGARAGTANIFCRMAGCNLKCSMEKSDVSPGTFSCDTNYSGSIEYTQQQLIEKIQEVGKSCKNIIFTGGEPALQVDSELCVELHKLEYYLAIETNGTKNLSHLYLDWISCSPKTAEHTIKVLDSNELRYVCGVNQALPKPAGTAEYYYLSPVFNPDWTIDQESLMWCVKLVKENPQWRLNLQTQKFIGLR